jgi:hypothetical protein
MPIVRKKRKKLLRMRTEALSKDPRSDSASLKILKKKKSAPWYIYSI